MKQRGDLKVGEIYLVSWLDAFASIGWEETKDLETEARCQSVGKLVLKTKDYIVLAGSFADPDYDDGEDTTTNNRISIPLNMITGIKRMEHEE